MLKELREEKKLNQEDVAYAASISRSAYCNIETGKRRPSIDVARRIAAALEIPEDRILDVFYKQKTPATKDG